MSQREENRRRRLQAKLRLSSDWKPEFFIGERVLLIVFNVLGLFDCSGPKAKQKPQAGINHIYNAGDGPLAWGRGARWGHHEKQKVARLEGVVAFPKFALRRGLVVFAREQLPDWSSQI